jgi:recombination protein RecT
MQTTATGNAVAAQGQQKPVELLKSVINAPSIQAQFKNALGEHKDAFVASLIDLYTGDRALQQCAPAALVTEALRAATLRLPLNKALGFAYIVVYNNNVRTQDAQGRDVWTKVPTPTFIPGYKGYIQLAMRTGQYRTINADVVYEGELRSTNKLTGEISFDGERTSDKVVGYFCYFQLLNGFSKTLYMSLNEMAAYAKKFSPSVKKATTAEQLASLAGRPQTDKKSVGWEGNFDDMAIKTVVRRLLSKYGYLSVEMQNAIAKDTEETDYDRRDEALTLAASERKTIPTGDTIAYEDVDPETGEILTPQQTATTAPAAAAPKAAPSAQEADTEEDPF